MSKTVPEAQHSLESFGYKQELKRSMSTLDLVVYGLVFMVPIAPWAIFGVVYNAAGGMVPLVYLTGVVAMIFTALAYAQMSKAFPIAGSVFSYVGRGLHPTVGFFAGWAILLDYLLIPTLLYVFAASSMAGIFPDVPQWIWAVAFVIVNTIVNVAGIGSIKLANRVMLLIQLAFVVIFVGIAFVALTSGTIPGAEFTMAPVWDAEKVNPALIATALSIAVLSFLGFDGISTMAEESTGNRNSAGRAMIIALLVVAVLFVAQTWFASALAAGTITFGDDEVNNAFFILVAKAAGSGWATAFLAVNVVAVGIANAIAAQAATSRLLYSMSRDRRLPAFLSKVNSRQVPMAAILLVSGVSLVLVLFFVGQIAVISSLVNFGALSGFLLLHVSVAYYYLVKKRSKNYLLHLVVPVVGFFIIGYVLLNADITAKIGGNLWLVVGAIVYVIFARKNGGASGPLPEQATSTAGDGSVETVLR
jgi:amino acid transporter